MTDPDFPATLSLICEGDQFLFSMRNKKRKHYSQRGYGIGIENAKTRLKEAYGESDFSLNIKEDAIGYALELRIKI